MDVTLSEGALGMEDLLHSRQINIEATLVAEDTMRVVGRLDDERTDPFITGLGNLVPAGTMHDMRVELEIKLPDLVITAATARMPQAPMEGCSAAAPWTEALIGLSVGGGITREIKKRLGGPRGCAHLGSLVLAMMQVVVQGAAAVEHRKRMHSGVRSASLDAHLLNSCHMWREDGELAQRHHERAKAGAAKD